jgi:transketolase
MRFTRDNRPVFTTAETPFEIGRAEVFWDEDEIDVAIIGCSPLLYNALVAANELKEEGIKVAVINNHTIKPMDIDTVVAYAKKAGAVVTVEEHQIAGGMGSAVAEALSMHYPVPMEYIGVHDRFGQSGEPSELVEYYGMGVSAIKEAVKKVKGRK